MINQAVKRIINCVTHKSVIFIIHVAEWGKMEKWYIAGKKLYKIKTGKTSHDHCSRVWWDSILSI